ncbi:glycosyltransferase [Microcella indica]|uniref:glycosyltransferase n=1 Tax=Microcella indica TaxID=2750620 RepID=UPI0015CF01C4|nr:glycosyltransferase [Microcella indica]
MSVGLRYLPDYSASNPYQSMLYSRASEFDVDVSAIALDDLDALDPAAGASIVHLHWTNPIIQRFTDPSRARDSMRHTLDALRRYRERGGRLVWTVHNVLPHDHSNHVLELELCQHLAREADVVHVLSASTLRAVEPYYPLHDATVIMQGHASFLGHYPDTVTREHARTALGVKPDDEVIVSVGGVRPYRGLERLAEAVTGLQRTRPRARLAVAGRPGRGTDVAALERALDAVPGTVRRLDFVPDDELQNWMRAADVAAMPYERILNSASFPLAQTFGVPVVAPDLGVFHDHRGAPYLHLYPARSTEGLVAALDAALRADDRAERAAAAREAAEAYPPAAMSRGFFPQLLGALGLTHPPSPHQ